MRPTILFVAFSNSIHTARWLDAIADCGWNLHLIPSLDLGVSHPLLRKVTVYHSFYKPPSQKNFSLTIKGIPIFSETAAYFSRMVLGKIRKSYQEKIVSSVIKKIKPDLIHSMEIQHAGYLTLAVKKQFGPNFPPWLVTNWGSDIFLFGRLKDHADRIREVLANCNFYSCECRRDIDLALNFGFKGKSLPVFPNAGGFDLERIFRLGLKRTSERRLIMLKGYQGWAGRALVGLRALARCNDLLKGYRIIIYSSSSDPSVTISAELFSRDFGIPIQFLPSDTPHEKMLELHGNARISIGLSISDAISTSFLEALVMGSFPIQSWTSCADEWIESGKTGLLVHPEDPEMVELAIRKALSDDNLVNSAAKTNFQTAQNKLEAKLLKEKTIQFYNAVLPQGVKE